MVRSSTHPLLLGNVAATMLAKLAFAPLTLARSFLECLAKERPITEYPGHLFALDRFPQCKLGGCRSGCWRSALPRGSGRWLCWCGRQPVCISRLVDFFNNDAERLRAFPKACRPLCPFFGITGLEPCQPLAWRECGSGSFRSKEILHCDVQWHLGESSAVCSQSLFFFGIKPWPWRRQRSHPCHGVRHHQRLQLVQ